MTSLERWYVLVRALLYSFFYFVFFLFMRANKNLCVPLRTGA